jgi:uncharacterized protein
VLDWAAHLPHADGRVGTYGPSYLGIDQMLLAGAVGRHSPLQAIFPLVSANDLYRDTSFIGGLLDFEFSEAYLGLRRGRQHDQSSHRHRQRPGTARESRLDRGRPRQRPGDLCAATTANVLSGGDEAYDGSYWRARNPQNVIQRIVANHIPRTCSGVSSTSSRTANPSTMPSYRTRGMVAASPRRCCPASGRPGAIS